jgi:hypothetical protein
VSQDRNKKTFTPTETQAKFIYSTKTYNILLSGRGEGKTTSGVIAMAIHALRFPQYQPIRWALVRDTRRSIGITTAQSVRLWFPEGIASKWRGKTDEPEFFEISINNKKILECYCFGADSLSDLNKFQSLELGGCWIEEPCPAADLSGGVSQDVFSVATTSLRQMPFPRFQITGNLPDANHWVVTTWGVEGGEEQDRSEEEQKSVNDIRANSTVLLIKKGENTSLDEIAPGYRERNENALRASGRADLIDRLVEGKVGSPKIGVAVTPEFSQAHIVDGLYVDPKDQLIMSWDWGLQPACVVGRLSPLGYLDIVASFQGKNEGVEQLIGRLIQPWKAIKTQGQPMKPILHTGDPNGVAAEASNSDNSAVKRVLQMLGGTFQQGPVKWDDRREPTHQALNRYFGGKPWVRIDRKECAGLIRSLDGGAHYARDPSGTVIRDGIVKDYHSHVFDAFSYMCAYLIGTTSASSNLSEWKKKQAEKQKSSQSAYSVTRTGV